jgi:hypothetical protein
VADVLHSAEFALLTACCRWPHSEAAVRHGTAGIDWTVLLRLVIRHRVVGLVHRALATAEIVPPPEVRTELARRADIIAQHNAMQAAETVQLQHRFAEAGITSLALKGAALAQLAYGSLELKHARDIDLLVLPEQAHAAWRLLEDNGYALALPAAQLKPAQRRAVLLYGKDVELVHRDSALRVELQWRAAANAHLLLGIDARARAQEVTLPQGIVRTLGARDLFAYLCVHGASHSWSRLKWLADLNALIADNDERELVALYRHTESIGAGSCAGQALLLCRRLLARKLPDEISAAVERDKHAQKLEAIALQAMARPSVVADRGFAGVMREISIQFMLGRGAGFLAEQCRVVAVGIDDVVRLPLPPQLAFLYPMIRLPLWLLRRLRWARR